MDTYSRLHTLIIPVIEDLGYDLVRLHISLGKMSAIQIMAERKDRERMQVEDCEKISRTLSPVLDVEDIIKSQYTLEVSSPGIDRPLVRIEDYERFKGFDAKIELSEALEDRKRFAGKIVGPQEDKVIIETENGSVEIPFSLIQKAKLILTDSLIKANITS